MMDDEYDWDNYFMDMAELVAEKSKDPSTKVGAVIVDERNIVSGMGYNGFPRGVNDDPERYEHRPTKYKMVVHAELNAILNSTRQLVGHTLYVTHPPCHECAKAIIQSGIKRVITQMPSSEFLKRMEESYMFTELILKEAEVELEFLQEDTQH